MKKTIVCLSVLLMFMLPVFCFGGGNEEGLKKVKLAAEQGDADAQLALGGMYHDGLGVPQDYAEAAKWLRKSAEQGNILSQYFLAEMYESGRGVPKDYAEALKWYRKGSEQGDTDAQFNIGRMYYKGQGVSQNYTEAAKWYRKAAEQGRAKAQFALGGMYADGRGVPKNHAVALKWYRKAAEQGNPGAQYNLGLMYYKGQGVPQDYAEAAKWYRKVAEQGLAEAQYNLSKMYLDGIGVPQDYAEAAKWLRKLAEQGNPGAQYFLGLMYAEGLGVIQSGAASADWFYKAGLAYLKANEKDMALKCVESIQDLKNKQQLNVPNYFLADQLMQQIYGGDATTAEAPKNQTESAIGTAWPVAAGFVVTACHVIQDHQTFSLLTKDGKKLNASVVMRDAANDIALLEVASPDDLPIAIPVATEQARTGDKVFAIGYPHPDIMGAEPKLTDGIISSLTGIGNDPRTYQISVPVQAGNSGGPLFNMNGEAIGIVISKLNAAEMFKQTNDITENVNYAVKTSYLNALLMALPNKHPIAVQSTKGESLSNLASRLGRSVMIVIAR